MPGRFEKLRWRLFSVFLLMAGLDIRSREAGMVLSLGTISSRSTLWSWFYQVARQGLARTILDDYYRLQIRAGLAGYYIWFTDGHLLPYTGKQNALQLQHSASNAGVWTNQSGRLRSYRLDRRFCHR